MEKYILQAPNCWHQFQGRVVGVGVPGPGTVRRTVVLGGGAQAARQVMEVEGGEMERAEGGKI
jgi:1-phosphatidylinositol-3-phosphate 5-kinase